MKLQSERHSFELVNTITKLFENIVRSKICSPPTAARTGKLAMDFLQASNLIFALSDVCGDPVLTHPQFEAICSKSFSTESDVVQEFTPFLQKIVMAASERSKVPLVLVNTERHAWVKDPHGGSPSKPDMLVTHPALYYPLKSTTDAKYDGPNFLFGKLADWCLRDSFTALLEWKVDIGDQEYTPLGEVVEYVQRIVSFDDSNFGTRAVLADKNGFKLLFFLHDRLIKCIFGLWTDAGSFEAWVSFFSQPSLLVKAIEGVCAKSALKIAMPSNDDPEIFLGSGGTGRVFKYNSTSDDALRYAVKIALESTGCSAIIAEHSRYSHNANLCPDELVIIKSSHAAPDNSYAFLVTYPVGKPFPYTKKSVQSSLWSLKKIAKADLHHGDPRYVNGVMDDEKIRWVDLQSLNQIEPGTNAKMFLRDVRIFSESLDLNVDPVLVEQYFDDDSILNALTDKFSSIWRK